MAGIGDEQESFPGVDNLTARVYAALGEADSAFAHLSSSPPAPGGLLHDPDYAPLREDPRWEELVRRAWRTFGVAPEEVPPTGGS